MKKFQNAKINFKGECAIAIASYDKLDMIVYEAVNETIVNFVIANVDYSVKQHSEFKALKDIKEKFIIAKFEDCKKIKTNKKNLKPKRRKKKKKQAVSSEILTD